MCKVERIWQFAEQFHTENKDVQRARLASQQINVQAISCATSAFLSQFVRVSQPKTVCEIGTGAGVSTLAMLTASENTHITSIDIDSEHHATAQDVFRATDIPSARLRLILGDAHKVLPRMNTQAYDLLFLDAEPEGLLQYLEQCLMLLRPGGTLMLTHALQGGAVTDPTCRENTVQTYRDLLSSITQVPNFFASLMPLDDGLLVLNRAA